MREYFNENFAQFNSNNRLFYQLGREVLCINKAIWRLKWRQIEKKHRIKGGRLKNESTPEQTRRR